MVSRKISTHSGEAWNLRIQVLPRKACLISMSEISWNSQAQVRVLLFLRYIRSKQTFTKILKNKLGNNPLKGHVVSPSTQYCFFTLIDCVHFVDYFGQQWKCRCSGSYGHLTEKTLYPFRNLQLISAIPRSQTVLVHSIHIGWLPKFLCMLTLASDTSLAQTMTLRSLAMSFSHRFH